MKVAIILIALFYVARGSPIDSKPAAPADQAPQAAPAAAPEKPETCTATIDGQQQTLQTGDRYCSDDTTSRVCSYGDWVDFKCDPGSKCLKSKTQWQVLCRIYVLNAPQNNGPREITNVHGDEPQANPAAAAPAAPQRDTPSKSSDSADDAPKPQAPPPAPAPANPAPAPADAPTKTDDQPKTCKATVQGSEATLQPGESYCSDDSTSKVCNYGGDFTEYKCPDQSKCLKSPEKFAVLCRIIVRNAPQNQPPATR